MRSSFLCILTLFPLLTACVDDTEGYFVTPGGMVDSGGSGGSGYAGHAGFAGTTTGGAGLGGSTGQGGFEGGGFAGDAGAGGSLSAGQGGDSSQAGAGVGGTAGSETGGTSGSSGLGGGGSAGDSAGGGNGGSGGAPPDPCALASGETGPFPGLLLADLALKVTDGTKEQDLNLHSLRTTCDNPGLLLIQLGPAWCGPCEDRLERFASLLTPFAGTNLQVVSILYANRDNAVVQEADLVAWRAGHPSLPGLVARPGDSSAQAIVQAQAIVPVVLLVNARTLQILSVERDPPDRFFQEDLAKMLALADAGTVDLGPDPTVLVDDRFDAAEWEQIQKMAQPIVPLPNPSNAHADDPAAATLGQALFFDKDLAGTHKVSCATCHDPAKGFADGLPVAEGVSKGPINSPTIVGSAAQRWFFWNGRADSLWSQALGPLENPLETAGSRLHVAHRIKDAYAAEFEALFGPLPDLQDVVRFPSEGKPGDATFDAMSEEDQKTITRIFTQVGKAIEAFERTVKPPPIRLEPYAAGNFDALSPMERDGLQGFLRSGCISCHYGPTLSDDAFHNILMSSNAPPADQGRIEGLAALLASPFRKDGPYSDDPQAKPYPATLVPSSEMLGQIHTPPLRNIAATGPWGHGGTFTSLDAVVNHYLTVRIMPPSGPQVTGVLDPATGTVPGDISSLVSFLSMLGESDPP